ncbi:MAG TPA: hypothetical protein VJH03_11545 [Blastocatellia bacterium]|nr:hypothetical protein [Blastocatellia bacterium]
MRTIDATRNNEKLVRGAYVKLMRYNSAYAAEIADARNQAPRREDGIEFELRNFHTGRISEITDELYEELVTEPTGDILNVTPSYRNQPDSPRFARYIVDWAKGNTTAVGRKGITVGEILGLGNDLQTDVDFYSSYEVTVRLLGKERTYRAMALYHKATQQDGRRRIELLDSITSNMNMVLEDNSPVVRSPWRRYVTTGSYFATVRTIEAAKEKGITPISEGGPIGFLPGDEAVPNQQDRQKAQLAAAAACAVPVTTDEVVVIAWVDSSRIDLPTGANLELKVSLNLPFECSKTVLAWAGGVPLYLYSDEDRAYANAFLLKNSGNAEPPPSINPDSILAGGDFRFFGRFKVNFSVVNGVITNPQYIQSVSKVGDTPDPCHFAPSIGGEAHPENGANRVTPSGWWVYLLTEGRIGKIGQKVSNTINGRTVPWIWTVIRFHLTGIPDFGDNAVYFPTYYVYGNGSFMTPYRQSNPSVFIRLDETWQRRVSEIQ